MIDIEDFVARYVAVWNEADPTVRREAIRELWAEDGTQYLESAHHRGHQELEARITEAHEKFVAGGRFVFRSAGDVVGHHDVVRFSTCMLPAGGGDVAWVGAIVAVLGPDGLIRRDHQFAEPPAPGVSTGTPPGTRAVVEEFLRRLGTGSPERTAEVFAETVDWRLSWPVAEHPAVPWIRPRSTRADVADHFRTLRETCDAGEVSVDRILVDGPEAVVTGASSQRVRPTGRWFSTAFALHITVQDGLLTRYHVYEDSLAVAEAFGG
jgi:ketosteroid isomerase-like protein